MAASGEFFGEQEKLALGSADLVDGGNEHGDAGHIPGPSWLGLGGVLLDESGEGSDGGAGFEAGQKGVMEALGRVWRDGELGDGGEDGFSEGFGGDAW